MKWYNVPCGNDYVLVDSLNPSLKCSSRELFTSIKTDTVERYSFEKNSLANKWCLCFDRRHFDLCFFLFSFLDFQMDDVICKINDDKFMVPALGIYMPSYIQSILWSCTKIIRNSFANECIWNKKEGRRQKTGTEHRRKKTTSQLQATRMEQSEMSNARRLCRRKSKKTNAPRE